jgi:hypothetical protein
MSIAPLSLPGKIRNKFGKQNHKKDLENPSVVNLQPEVTNRP